MVLLGYLGRRNRAMFCAISENVSHFKNILSRFPSICETIWWEWFCVSDCRRAGGPLPSHSRVFPSIWNSTCKFIQQIHKELWIQSPELCIWHQWGRPITNQHGHPPSCTPYTAVGNWEEPADGLLILLLICHCLQAKMSKSHILNDQFNTKSSLLNSKKKGA